MVAREALEDREETLPVSNLALNSEALLVLVSLLMARCRPSHSAPAAALASRRPVKESRMRETLRLFWVLIFGSPKASTSLFFFLGTRQSSLSDFLLESLPGLGGLATTLAASAPLVSPSLLLLCRPGGLRSLGDLLVDLFLLKINVLR